MQLETARYNLLNKGERYHLGTPFFTAPTMDRDVAYASYDEAAPELIRALGTSLAHKGATLEDPRRSRLCPAYHSSGPSREALHASLKPLERPSGPPGRRLKKRCVSY